MKTNGMRIHNESAKPGFDEWNLDEFIIKAIKKNPQNFSMFMGEFLNELFFYMFADKENSCSAQLSFPFTHFPVDGDSVKNAKCPENPLTIRLSIPWGKEEFNDAYFDFDLDSFLLTYLDYCKEDGSYCEGLQGISKGLKDLCKKIDDALQETHGVQA